MTDLVSGTANEPKAVVHAAVNEAKTALDTVNGLIDQAAGVVEKTAGMGDTELKSLLDQLETAADAAYTQVTNLLHLTKPGA